MALTDRDFAEAAALIGCDVPAIRAIDEVESSGAGFREDGKPKILFEPHLFRELTEHRFDVSHKHLSHPRVSGARDPSYNRDQYKVLKEAGDLDPEASMAACSWGRYQILGKNWSIAGHRTLMDFIRAMYENEGEHLKAFVHFSQKKPGLAKAIREHDWDTVARLYNGSAYREAGYHNKLAKAFAKHGGK